MAARRPAHTGHRYTLGCQSWVAQGVRVGSRSRARKGGGAGGFGALEGGCLLRPTRRGCGGRQRGLPVEGLGLLLLRTRKLSAAKMASHFMYLSAAQEGTPITLVSTRLSRCVASVRACEGFISRRNFPHAHAVRAAWPLQAATIAEQTDGRMRGARGGPDGGITHLSNSGLGQRGGRVLRGRREAGDGAASWPRE